MGTSDRSPQVHADRAAGTAKQPKRSGRDAKGTQGKQRSSQVTAARRDDAFWTACGVEF